MKKTTTLLITVAAMIAFAANSLICRFTLRHTALDPASFTAIRILSGALTLWLVVRLRRRAPGKEGNWQSGLSLFVYAAAFSFAYVSLPTGTGALLLFAAVQATMIAWGLRQGETLHAIQFGGLALAAGGLILLLLPGLSAPPIFGSLLMLSAGVAWGVYSLRGKSVTDPARATAGNFLRATPLAALLYLACLSGARFDRVGVAWAVISGALTSGLGYIIWYAALPQLRATTAASVQLSVPVLAALGGILFLGESLTLRAAVASVAVLSGIALVVLRRRAPA